MSEPESRAGFDQRERELVRSALRRYMEENRIGTPTLLYRIIEADPRRREIPLSTLQRFITGAHHTQDHHVALCHAFVRDLPYYGEGRDIGAVRGGADRFLQRAHSFDTSKAVPVSWPRSLLASLKGVRKQRRGVAPLPGRERRTVLWSRLSLTVAPEQPFLVARELVMDLFKAVIGAMPMRGC